MIHKIHNACYNIIKVFTNYYSNDKKQGGNEGKGCNDQKRGGVLQACLLYTSSLLPAASSLTAKSWPTWTKKSCVSCAKRSKWFFRILMRPWIRAKRSRTSSWSPVSYTHLGATRAYVPLPENSWGFKPEYKDYAAVSYTHLDVYKRQRFSCSRQFSIW